MLFKSICLCVWEWNEWPMYAYNFLCISLAIPHLPQLLRSCLHSHFGFPHTPGSVSTFQLLVCTWSFPGGHPNILTYIFSSALYNYHAKKWWYHTLRATHGLPSREVGKCFLLCFPLISSGTVLVARFWDNCLMSLTAISHFPSVQSCCCQNSSNTLIRSPWYLHAEVSAWHLRYLGVIPIYPTPGLAFF